MRTVFAALFALALVVVTGASASAGKPVANPEKWVAETMDILKTGDMEAFQQRFTDILGEEMVTEVTATVSPFVLAMDDAKAVYVDRLDVEKLGTSFETYTYAIYLGNREFLFASITFARVEEGMSPIAFSFDEVLGAVL